jgi:transposase
MTAQIVAGIDVGKQWLDGVALPSGEYRRVANTTPGWGEVVRWLVGAGVELVVLEASGGYERGVTEALDAAGVAVAVGNPWQLRKYAERLGQRAQTDRIDAALLARSAQPRPPAPTPRPDQLQRTVAALTTRRRQLIQIRTAEQNRLEHADPVIREQVEAHIAWLTEQLKTLEPALADQFTQDAGYQARLVHRMTVPGFGLLTASRLLVDLPELGRVSAKVINALVGIAPYARDSGQLRGRRTISGGRKWLRQALFEAVVTTTRCDPTFRAYSASLREAGKPHKVAMIAGMRRLLGIVTAMVRDGLTWQQTQVGQGHFLASEG